MSYSQSNTISIRRQIRQLPDESDIRCLGECGTLLGKLTMDCKLEIKNNRSPSVVYLEDGVVVCKRCGKRHHIKSIKEIGDEIIIKVEVHNE